MLDNITSTSANIRKKVNTLTMPSEDLTSTDVTSILLDILKHVKSHHQSNDPVPPTNSIPTPDDVSERKIYPITFSEPDKSKVNCKPTSECLNKEYKINSYKPEADIKLRDSTYGLRLSNTGSLLLGSTPIEIKGGKLYIANQEFPFTSGLKQLLTSTYPEDYTDEDAVEYKKLLMLTNAHRYGYVPSARIKWNKGRKYREIIAKLFPPSKKWLKRKEKNATVTSTNQSFSSKQSDADEDGNSLNNITPAEQSLSPKVDPL